MLAFGMVGNVKAGVLDSLQLRARVGYNIGGTAPIPMPETIRSIDSYTLTPSFMVGVDALLPLSPKWGISLGVHFENKGMDGAVGIGINVEVVDLEACIGQRDLCRRCYANDAVLLIESYRV